MSDVRKMRIVHFAWLVLATTWLQPTAAADRFDEVREYIRSQLLDTSTPSLAVAVAQDGKIVWEQGFGWADRERRIAATEHTVYSLASISKPITATGLMVLAQSGALDLDRPANDYLGNAKLRARVGNASDATVRLVANNTSGLPRHLNFFFADEPFHPPSMDETILRYGNLVTAPGERFQYSNLGFGVLDYIIERVSGVSYERFMRQNVFLPLGMTRTSVGLASELEQYAATRYGEDGLRVPSYDSDHPGASVVFASAHDLVRFGMFHLKAHLPDQKAILSDTTIDEMHRPTASAGQFDYGDTGYGIGFMSFANAGHKVVFHDGGMIGVATQMLLIPDRKLAIVVLSNASTRAAPVVADRIAEKLLPGWRKAAEQEPVKVPFVTSSELSGVWKGTLSTYTKDVPVELRFQPDGEVHAKFGDQLTALVNDAQFKDGVFTGELVTRIDTPDTARGEYTVSLSLKLRGDVLNGPIHTLSFVPRMRSALAHWVELRKEAATSQSSQVDVLIRDGEIYDGSGGTPYRGDIAIRGDRVVAIGPRLAGYRATRTIDAGGRAVAPGFINVLSWAPETLIQDGRGMSDTLQGVTLELFGEGDSMGPLTPRTRDERLHAQTDVKYAIEWTTLSEYLEYLVKRGVSPNVASFVGAATLRTAVVGFDDRAPTAEELARMQELVRAEMRNGALGIGSALIYAPGTYARPDEIRALVAAAAEYGGGYSSHMRNEADRLLESVDEIIDVGRTTGAHVEVHHFKAAGTANWPKMRVAIDRIVKARADGVKITANMYPYIAGATGLDAAMPPWVQEGGNEAWFARLKDPTIRARVIEEMRKPGDNWDNLYAAAGSPTKVMFIGFRTEALKQFTGKTVDEVARVRGRSPEDTIVDLVIEDSSRIETAYFHMSEDNVRLGLQQPWVSLESDAEAMMPEGVFLKSNPHPRAYGAFARFLGRYVRDQRVTTLPEAIRRLTRLPAENWQLRERGCIDPGCHADIVIFDPRTITDHATFERPHQLATGVDAVFVNGVQVVRDGQHTSAKPGQVVRGPGWTGWSSSAPGSKSSARRPRLPRAPCNCIRRMRSQRAQFPSRQPSID